MDHLQFLQQNPEVQSPLPRKRGATFPFMFHNVMGWHGAMGIESKHTQDEMSQRKASPLCAAFRSFSFGLNLSQTTLHGAKYIFFVSGKAVFQLPLHHHRSICSMLT
jgi:hypothetical protein